MPALTAALISGGLSFGQGMLNSRAQRKQRQRYNRRMGRALNATESIQGRALGQREALTRRGTEQMVGGFDTARREASRLGRTGRQAALDRGTQLQASATQGLASRGLGSTTVGTNVSRAIGGDTSRQMQSINEGLAGIYGDLALGRAGAEQQGSMALSGLANERGDQMSQLAQMRNLGEMYSSSPWGGSAPLQARENSFGQNLLGGIQTGMGAYMGMGGGGGGGGMGGLNMEDLMWLFGGNKGSFGSGGFGHDVLQGPMRSNGQY